MAYRIVGTTLKVPALDTCIVFQSGPVLEDNLHNRNKAVRIKADGK